MEAALRLARAAAVREEVPVGAVIVRNDEGDSLAEAHNEMMHRKDPTAHAELLAIQRALAALEDRPPAGRHAVRHAGTVCPVRRAPSSWPRWSAWSSARGTSGPAWRDR